MANYNQGKKTQLSETEKYTTQIARDGSGNVEYVGKARPGTATSVAHWQIFRITWTGSDPDTVEWANGDKLFDNIWDDRVSISYS